MSRRKEFMRVQSHGSGSGQHQADLIDGGVLLVNGTLPAAILVGAGLGLAMLGLSVASLWQWLG